MKKADRKREIKLQKKREKARAKRKGKTYNPMKHWARYKHQDSVHPDNQTVEL